MTIADAFKEFFYILNGVKPTGANIAEVVQKGTSSVQRNNESALTTRMAVAEEALGALENAVTYADATQKSFVLASSTADSEKTFSITVADNGTITATEIV